MPLRYCKATIKSGRDGEQNQGNPFHKKLSFTRLSYACVSLGALFENDLYPV